MKHVLIILLSFFSLTASAQIYQNRPEYGWNFNRIKISSTLTLPRDTAIRSNNTDAGAIVYNMSDSSLYVWNGAWWLKQGRVGAYGTVTVPILHDSLNNMTLQRVTENGDTTNRPISLLSYTTTPLILKQRSANMLIRWDDAAGTPYGAIGDAGSGGTFEIASYGMPLALTSSGPSPVQIRVNTTQVVNVTDSNATFTKVVEGITPINSNHLATKNYVDTTARNAVWRTQLTPLLTQPASPIQPTDTLTQALGKLQAQILNINSSTYVQVQTTGNQGGGLRMAGEIQSASAGSFGGWYTSGITGPLAQVGVTGGVANILGFNRTTSAYIATKMDGLTLALNSASTGNVGIRNAAPSFNVDITGTTRIGGVNYKMFLDRTAVATQDNIIAFRSPGTSTSTDTIAYLGLASRADNSVFLTSRQGDIVMRLPVGNTYHFSTHIDGNGTSRKDVTNMRDGKWIWGDSVLVSPQYPIQVTNVQDTSIHAAHKVLSQGGFIGPQLPPIRTVTTSQTLLATDRTLLVNNSGAVTMTLPTAASVPGLILTVKKFSTVANNVSIQPAGAELLDGSNAAKVLTLQYSAITVQSNGAGWIAISYYLAATTL